MTREPRRGAHGCAAEADSDRARSGGGCSGYSSKPHPHLMHTLDIARN
jgi:hypothetical protein